LKILNFNISKIYKNDWNQKDPENQNCFLLVYIVKRRLYPKVGSRITT